MSGAIVHNQVHGVHPTIEGFWNDGLLNKALEVHKTFPRMEGLVDLSVSHRESCKQIERPMTVIARCLQLGASLFGWTGWLLSFTCLDRGFLIQAHQPDPLLEQREGLHIEPQNWSSPLKKLLGIMNMLPIMVAPWP
jgi:hypothetical protein